MKNTVSAMTYLKRNLRLANQRDIKLAWFTAVWITGVTLYMIFKK